MGNQKQKWTAEEEDALLSGVAKHGPGKWKNILRDPEFAPFLTHRSNIDLKDKWRNLSVSTPKRKALSLPAAPSSTSNSAPPTSRGQNVASDAVADDPLDGKNAPMTGVTRISYYCLLLRSKEVILLHVGIAHNDMIFEALSTKSDTNGSDIGAIVNFIEQKHGAQPNLRRLLSSRLRRLVLQGKLEKVQNCYKISKDTSLGTRAPTPKQKDNRSGVESSDETLEEASMAAAYKIADAENKSFMAAEAIKDAEKISKMAEDTDSMLQVVKEIYEQCLHGENFLLA